MQKEDLGDLINSRQGKVNLALFALISFIGLIKWSIFKNKSSTFLNLKGIPLKIVENSCCIVYGGALLI